VDSCRPEFIKTSTGYLHVAESKHPPVTGASLDAVQAILSADGFDTGIKVSGGIKTMDDAAGYMRLVHSRLGPLHSGNFRIGASQLALCLMQQL